MQQVLGCWNNLILQDFFLKMKVYRLFTYILYDFIEILNVYIVQ